MIKKIMKLFKTKTGHKFYGDEYLEFGYVHSIEREKELYQHMLE